MQHTVMTCPICNHIWLVPHTHLAYPNPPWCHTCNAATGCIAETLRPHDTEPGRAADLFEQVMLDWLADRTAGEAARELRAALGLEPVER